MFCNQCSSPWVNVAPRPPAATPSQVTQNCATMPTIPSPFLHPCELLFGNCLCTFCMFQRIPQLSRLFIPLGRHGEASHNKCSDMRIPRPAARRALAEVVDPGTVFLQREEVPAGALGFQSTALASPAPRTSGDRAQHAGCIPQDSPQGEGHARESRAERARSAVCPRAGSRAKVLDEAIGLGDWQAVGAVLPGGGQSVCIGVAVRPDAASTWSRAARA